MNKEFIPYEQALELKELGFNEKCLNRFYTKPKSKMFGVDEKGRHFPIKNTSKKLYTLGEHYVLKDDNAIIAPLYQQAFRWFREKYGLYSEIFVDDNKTFGFYITSFIEEGRLDKPITRQFNTYDEAELGCVKQLIEIIERKAEAYQ